METNTKEMKTVKEWEKITGLKLRNYDGFTKIYLTLSGRKSDDFYDNQIIRNRDSGDLLCTRRGFESGLINCTMEQPEISSLEKLADIIPDFVESQINLYMSSTYNYLKYIESGDIKQRENVERLLELLKLKNVVKDKSIKINRITKENEITKLKKEKFSQKEYKLIKRFNILKINKGTVEELEVYLLNKIIKKLEKILQKSNAKLTDDLLDKIHILNTILYDTARRENNKDIREEFMYINLPHEEKDFEQPYNIIDGTNIKNGKIFSYKVGDTTIRGAVPVPSDSHDEKNKRKGSKR